MRKGDVHETLRRLDDDRLDHVVVGGMALVEHGYRRATEGAAKIFRDTAKGVRVEGVTTGEFPRDGRPKPVRFPTAWPSVSPAPSSAT